MTEIALLLALAPNGWLLGPRDLVAVPTRTSPGTALRREIEDRYYATPLYERKALAMRERERTKGLAQLVWLSLQPQWLDGGDATPRPGPPKGVLPVNDDREVLRARFLTDYRRMYSTVYNRFLSTLLDNPDVKDDYRLLRTASFNCFRIGGDMKKAVPLALAAEALRPENPTTWWTMQDTYYNCIAYGVGNGQENWKAYLRYADRYREFALASKTPAGREDARRIDIDRRWLGKFLRDNYRSDGTVIKKT